MPDLHKNFAYSTVATAPSPATTGVSLVLNAGDGAKFPTPPFNATIWPAAAQPTTGNSEIVRVTAISTDTLTIVRQQEGTSARTVIVGDQIQAGLTAKVMTDAETVLGGVTGGVLAASIDYIAVDVLEVSATDSFEIPATSTVEIEPILNYLVGEITMYGGVQAPAGWFFCDGSAVSRTTYSGLFRVIGTTFGVGDGSTTFNVPDFRGRSPVGAGTGTAASATAKTLGSQPTTGIGGEEKHTMTTAEMVAHTHGPGSGTDYRTYFATGGNLLEQAGTQGGTSSTTASTGSTTPFNVMHAMSVVNFIIRY